MASKRRYEPPPSSSPDGRAMCYRCYRPSAHCVCTLVQPFEAHCNILLLQHPNERRKYYSTSKLVLSGIINSRLLRGVIFPESVLQSALGGSKPFLLYPGPEAADCEEFSLNRDSTIIAIDGTWSEAGKIVFRNPYLQGLPRISFKQALRSNYRIRKQPRERYLSTIESIGHLLMRNAAVSGRADRCVEYQRLFDGFNQMVEKQLAYWPSRGVDGNQAKDESKPIVSALQDAPQAGSR